ncbi:RagB/SusD family nutrient uptake outer membrane protein [Bacteroides ovatus]|nr:RagB/SusD family nutrient uptake outer membrane protein [Bacteroides ovatus]
MNTQIQFSTSEKARAALYGCYGYFALTSGGYGQHWQEVPVRYSGFGWAQTNGNTNDMCGWLQCDYTDDLLTNAWYVMYKVINETNAFIANVESTSLEDKDEMAAEARFLRALSYYNLAICWGDVPLKTTPFFS